MTKKKVFNPDDLTDEQLQHAVDAKRIAQEIGVPPNLMLAAIFQESNFDPNAKSKTGPVGLGQLSKAAAKDTDVKDRYDPIQNMYGTAKYLKARLADNKGDARAALADYHDGPRAMQTGRATPAATTHADTVLGHLEEINKHFPETAQPITASDESGVIRTREPYKQVDIPAVEEGGNLSPEWGGMEYATTGLGAGVGAALSPSVHKQQILNQNAQDIAKAKNEPIIARNKAQDQAYIAAMKLRNDTIEKAKKAQELQGVDKYTSTQVKGPSSIILQNDPRVITNEQVQGQLPKVAQSHERALRMEPTWAANIDPVSGLSLPSRDLFTPASPTLEQLHPMPDAPRYENLNQPKVHAIKGRRALGSVGGALTTAGTINAYGGDNVDTALGTVTAGSGAVATGAHNPRVAAGAAAVGAGSAGLQYLYDKAKEAGLIKGYSGRYGSLVQEVPELTKKLVGAAQGPLSRMLGRSEIIQPTAQEIAQFAPRGTQQMKFSEAIAPHEGKYLGVNMSDRFGTHGKRMGGTGFPNFQNVNPLHKANDVVWMNDSEGAANKMIASSKYNGQPVIHTNYIGAPDQHASNKTVHNDIIDNFYKNLAAGKISEEQIAKINAGIAARARDTGTLKQRPFSQNFDIRDKFAVQEIAGNTFEARGALSRMLGTGEGVGKSKNIAVPNYEQILQSHADPLTQGAPTSALGTRLYEVYDQPSMFSEAFHPDYRWTVHGKDQGVQFSAVPQSVGVRDFHSEYKSRFPDAEPHGNAWFSYPKRPQLITEDYIRNAQEQGFSRGGLV